MTSVIKYLEFLWDFYCAKKGQLSLAVCLFFFIASEIFVPRWMNLGFMFWLVRLVLFSEYFVLFYDIYEVSYLF